MDEHPDGSALSAAVEALDSFEPSHTPGTILRPPHRIEVIPSVVRGSQTVNATCCDAETGARLKVPQSYRVEMAPRLPGAPCEWSAGKSTEE
jgi:hypothetical protein